MRKLKLVLFINRPIIREGILNLLQSEPMIEIVSKCTTAGEAIDAAKRNKADIILVDVVTPEEVLNELNASTQEISPVNIIALVDSAYNNSRRFGYLFPMIFSGATGIISSECDLKSLISTISLVADGWLVIEPSLARIAVQTLQHTHRRLYQAKPERISLLSKQEKNVLALMMQYSTNKEIAASLSTSENTIKAHIRNILRKLEARNRREAVICGVEHGL